MKKLNILITASLLLALSQVHAQSIITYDFQNRSAGYVDYAEYNQKTIYHIQNINRLLYKVSINGEVLNYNTTPNAIFELINKKPETSNLPSPPSSEESAARKENEVFSDSLIALNQIKINALSKQRELMNLENKMYTKQKSHPNDNSLLIDELEKLNLEAQIEKLNKEIADRKSQNLKDNARANLFFALHNKRETFLELEGLKTYLQSLRELLLDPSTNKDNVQMRIQELIAPITLTQSIQQLQMGFAQMQQHFQEAVQAYITNTSILSEFNNDPKKAKESISKPIQQSKEIDSLYLLTDYNALITSIRQVKRQLNDENLFEVSSPPIQATGDAIKFKVQIEPKAITSNLPYAESMTFETRVPVKGGIKIDFSTGAAFRFGAPDDMIVKRAVGADSSQLVLGQNDNMGSLSLAAFMHVYKRKAKNYQCALTFGLGLNSTDIKDATVFMGGGLVIGSEKRAILSGGLSVAQAKRLDPRYSFNQTYLGAALPEDLSTNVTRLSAFIAFSYNISQ